MISSGPSIGSGPPHPEAAEYEAATRYDRHRQRKSRAGPEVCGDDQGGEAKADRGEGPSEPQSGDRIAEQEQRRPEGHLLARAKIPDEVGPDPAEGVEQQERGERPHRRAGADGLAAAENDDRA